MRRKIILTGSLLIVFMHVCACPVCERANEKKLLSGIGHGTGPGSVWDYVAVAVTMVIVGITLFYTIKWLVNPAEKNSTHIKYSILNP
jgi:hypothetical protein